jgi:ABC-type lipoprotein export system ATPase subunit/ABC-type antimicrobial peptide transport system permease subunit
MFPVLKGVNLTFNRGEFVSVLGESGCGKSTLMNLIGGLDSEFEGEIIVDNQSISNFTEKQLDDYRKARIGFIFQSFNLISHLSVLDNVTVSMALTSTSRAERELKAIDLLTELGLRDHIHKKPNQLSGGQKQRVAMARALANDPDIILADEPTGALDNVTTEEILSLLTEVANKGKLIIAVTHSQRVANHSDRIVKIDDGVIVEEIHNNEDLKPDFEDYKHSKPKSLSLIESIKMSFNNMRQKWVRNVLVSAGASIGITSVVLILSLGAGVRGFIQSEINQNVNPLVLPTSIDYFSEERRNQDVNFEEDTTIDRNDMLLMSEIDHVERVEPVIQSFGGMRVKNFEGEYEEGIMYSSIGSTQSLTMIHGEMPSTFGDAVISKDFAEKLLPNENVNVEQLIGQKLEFEMSVWTGRDNVNMQDSITIKGISESESGFFSGMQIVYMPVSYFQFIYNAYAVELTLDTVNVIVDDTDNVAYVEEELKKIGYASSFQQALFEELDRYLVMATTVLSVIAGISLVVSSIMILVVLYISVVERTKEIGVLRAVGARRKDIKRIFFSEAFLLGLLGGIIGVAFAILYASLINNFTINLYQQSFVDTKIQYALLAIFVSTAVSVIAGVIPASVAANLDPIESLRHE